jgi:2-oxoisovalerate dehydrogenase E1 component alpha subunit
MARDKEDHPISRLRAYMTDRGWWSDERDDELKKEARKAIMTAFAKAEKIPKPAIKHLFTEVQYSPRVCRVVSANVFWA